MGDVRLQEMASSVADAYERDEVRVMLFWPRRPGKGRFRALLDQEMSERGWTVVEPGVYQPPSED